jgi:hypothetical protein
MRVVALTAHHLSFCLLVSVGGAGEGRVKRVCCSRETAYVRATRIAIKTTKIARRNKAQ